MCYIGINLESLFRCYVKNTISLYNNSIILESDSYKGEVKIYNRKGIQQIIDRVCTNETIDGLYFWGSKLLLSTDNSQYDEVVFMH